MTRERITEEEIRYAALVYTRKRERVEALLYEAVEFERPLEAAWLAQRIVNVLDEEAIRSRREPE